MALDAAAGSPLRALQMLEDGSMEQYRLVSTTLDTVGNRAENPAAAMMAFSEIDPGLLWTWLSLRAAAEVKTAAGEAAGARALGELQRLADVYRNLVPTPVRKDLLLQDWLIQWARLKEQGS